MLRGRCREELKKVKHVVQYAVFAAYHLSLETSFLADEGATLPKIKLNHSASERAMVVDAISVTLNSLSVADACNQDDGSMSLSLEHDPSYVSSSVAINHRFEEAPSVVHNEDLVEPFVGEDLHSFDARDLSGQELQDNIGQEVRQIEEMHELTNSERANEDEVSTEYYPPTDTHQSILVSFSSRCVIKGTVCERSRLLRIKFYGSFDKPLGRYLRDDLFDQVASLRYHIIIRFVIFMFMNSYNCFLLLCRHLCVDLVRSQLKPMSSVIRISREI